jgi:aminopeptidase N
VDGGRAAPGGEHNGTRTAHQSFERDDARAADLPFWQIIVADPQRDTMFASAVYRRGGMTLQALREKISGQDLDAFFQTWIYSAGKPTSW